MAFKYKSLGIGLAAAILFAACGEEGANAQVENNKDVKAQNASVTTNAADQQPNAAAEGANTDTAALIMSKIKSVRPDLVVSDISPSPVKGIYNVTISGGGTLYVSEDANHFFLGDLYRIGPNRLVNLSEEAKNKDRMAMMASLNDDDAIVFSPAGEVKASVAVFTDVDCGYCRKLHQEVPKMNELGIEVKYLAFPRAGIGSKSYEKIASAWCAEDKRDALTKLKNGKSIDIAVCDGNPVANQYELGGKLGVRGTPAIVLKSGEIIPGYLPADELAKQLGI